ncbi:MAG: cytidine deaminase [Bacteroidales bacterium]|nr:cytidine deaminase [Bacteroidales bacterium]MDY5357511.1 cytidine deaminase [Candidatus Cryptobacteroides sp.]
MTNKEIKIAFTEYAGAAEMEAEDRTLVEKAIEATKHSYAPYSNFNVGAALLLDNGEIVTGSNQENAAYPSGLCAERTAMFYASSQYPQHAILKIAIAATQGGVLCGNPATPCGSCRQVMAQYQLRGGKPMQIILAGGEKILKFEKVDDLLPLIFDSI